MGPHADHKYPTMVKIAEIERNYIEKDQLELPRGRGRYKGKLPINVFGYEALYGKGSRGHRAVTLWDGRRCVAELTMEPVTYHGIKAYSVETAMVNPKYQGRGIGAELYKTLVSDMGIVLVSNQSHSPGARKTWLRLSTDPSVNVYGFDLIYNTVFKVGPNRTRTELKGKGQELYDSDGTGVVMVRKGSHEDKIMASLLKLSAKRNEADPLDTNWGFADTLEPS